MNIRALEPRVLYAVLLPILLLVFLLALNVGPVEIDLGKGMRDWFNQLTTIE